MKKTSKAATNGAHPKPASDGQNGVKIVTRGLAEPLAFRLPSARRKTDTVTEVDPYWGGNRSFWNERVIPTPRNNFKPPILSYVDRKKGARTGIRFVDFASAKAYFEKIRQPAEDQKPTGKHSKSPAHAAT